MRFGFRVPHRKQPNQRDSSETSAGKEGCSGSEPVPKPSGDTAGKKQGCAARQVEETEGGSAQVGRGGVCDHCSQQPLGHTHVQTPKGHARGQDGPSVGRGKDDICKDQQAKAAGTYDAVKRWTGEKYAEKPSKAYAMTNQMEYFAEVTEAYFDRNDMEPFDLAELKAKDSGVVPVLEKVWGLR